MKVDRFEVAMCSSMYKITDHPFLIRFISLTIIDEVITGALEINLQSRLDCSKSPSDCEHKPRTPRETNTATLDTRDNPNRYKGGNNISTCSLLLSHENSLHAQDETRTLSTTPRLREAMPLVIVKETLNRVLLFKILLEGSEIK
ncbi:hypothetical protein YC2023_082610 [Brassica napus]